MNSRFSGCTIIYNIRRQLLWPVVDSIEVKRRGAVRQAKLYYLRELSGRKARITEKSGKK